jgi:competence protein ComEA
MSGAPSPARVSTASRSEPVSPTRSRQPADSARGSMRRELNLAAALDDGQHLLIPSRDDPASDPGSPGETQGTAGTGSPAGAGRGALGGLIDLNHATAAELDTLPGIGPATAAKIIAARAETPFSSVQDLRDRKLVGQKTFDGLRDLVTVR